MTVLVSCINRMSVMELHANPWQPLGLKYAPDCLRGPGGLHQDFLEIDFLFDFENVGPGFLMIF